jgi:putative transposase
MCVRAVAEGRRKISYARYRFPPEVLHQAIWLYLRFTLSFRDVEDLLAERGIVVSYETVRRWVNHFGPMITAHLRKRRPKPHATWHLDEGYLKVDGRMVYPWRIVDAEGEVLDVLVQSKRNKHAALKLMRKLLKKYAFAPERLVTDDLQSYAPAARDLGIEHLHERGRWRNASADPTAGAQDAALQERGLRAEIPFSPRRRVQHFQRPTPSHVSSITPRAPRRGDDNKTVLGAAGLSSLITLLRASGAPVAGSGPHRSRADGTATEEEAVMEPVSFR